MTSKTEDGFILDGIVRKIELLRDAGDLSGKLLHASRDKLIAPRLRQELGDDPSLVDVSNRLGRLLVQHPILKSPVDAPPDKPVQKARDAVRGMTLDQKLAYANRQAELARLELRAKKDGAL